MYSIRHTGFFVDDIEGMKEFYCKYFDMAVAVHDVESGDYITNLYGIKGRTIRVELYKLATQDGCLVEILKIMPDTGRDVHSDEVFYKGCAHLAFTVRDVEAVYRNMLEDGISFYSSPLLSSDKQHKVCFCRDPEGNYLELVQEL